MQTNHDHEKPQKDEWTTPQIIDLDILSNTAGGSNPLMENLDFMPAVSTTS